VRLTLWYRLASKKRRSKQFYVTDFLLLFMKKFSSLVAFVVVSVSLWSCANWVQDTEFRRDVVQDEALDNVSQVTFLVTGIQRAFSLAYGQSQIQAGGLSDELIFDGRVPNATFPTYQNIDLGIPQLDNNSVTGLLNNIGNYRFLSDTLITRMIRIRATTDTAANRVIINRGFYQAYMNAGIARHLYAAYIGIDARRGGGVIASSPFIPSTAMHDSALVMLNRALPFAANAAEARLVNTIIAKIHVVEGRYALARVAALNGMRTGDVALRALFSAQTISPTFWTEAGRGRAQFVPDPRFARYILADAKEGRIFPGGVSGTVIVPTTVGDAELGAAAAANRLNLIGPIVRMGLTFHLQAVYPNQDTPQPFTSWQENSLILAETAARSGDDVAALTSVNDVRRAYLLDARTVTNLDSIYIERDKTLFGTGSRLTDQRRFDRWHLAPTTWWYLPITIQERNTNPNLRGQ
jgi:starch-binding outer membrane protein, SusD/RagB family